MIFRISVIKYIINIGRVDGVNIAIGAMKRPIERIIYALAIQDSICYG